jgi:NAD dependent epimerase/dehydratase family enzyme
MANEAFLASQRVTPRRLVETGFVFRDPDLARALRRLLGRE